MAYLNEKFKSWRMTSTAVYNKKINTYDPRIYDSLSANFDTTNKEGFNFHGNVTVDPWSFTGNSTNITVANSGTGDTADVELRYWSNTAHIVNNTVYSKNTAATINIPEMEVNNYKTEALTENGYYIPGQKIAQQFQPVRELWFDYNKESVNFRFFPIAYQDQALTSDDPLGITNHRIWWEDSYWLRRYTPGVFHSSTPGHGAAFTKGKWDDTYSFLTKDSTGKYLTALRGFSFNLQPSEDTYFASTLSTPKDLWQDYATVDNIVSATRFKQNILDNLSLGATFTARLGFTSDSDMTLDAQNYVGGLDLGYEIFDGLKAQGEVLTSQSYSNTTNETYKSKSQGNAYYFSLVTRYPRESIMDLKYSYDDIKPPKDGSFLLKARLYGARMDTGFDSALSNYHNTRQDVFWGRHIHFRKPFEYYYSGLEGPTTKWDELDATRIGDGIDIGRNAFGFRIEAGKADVFNNLFDIRYVNSVKGEPIETVVRDELAVKITDKLTAKGLGIYQRLPKTTVGVDPTIFDGNTGQFWDNPSITVGGQDPSLKTGSVGLNYEFFDWLSINGIYERTNDYTLAYGDFPRNVYRNDTTMDHFYYQNDNQYVDNLASLYNQQYFPLPPYSFYNVFKAGCEFSPFRNMNVYLDYAQNDFKSSGQVSDGMNHVGMDITYMPFKKFGMAFKYVYSRWRDPNRLALGYTNITGHNNFFGEFRYFPSKDDELILQYGEGNSSQIGNMTLDPYGGSNLTIDTQHIVRAYYRRRF
ncbi:MAG: hypothetical protein NTZ63_01710 [Candidatus Omnitrophica bacterium]|nr:hypothetical protein [Candidatus Omnitrophota bacterium]